MFRPLPPEADFASLEEGELARWRAADTFARSVAAREGHPRWTFYEGPPTANNHPGVHHVWARAYKDLFCRYRTMRGYLVERRAGWDTHGLPVEVEVEKRLGITSKRDIEDGVGIANFVRLCRESVVGYVEEWKALTERIGYWTDFEDAYWTFDRSYVESVWWHLKQLFTKGLLYEDTKVVPYCPRCGTALSSHELGQPGVYSDEEDESAYVKLPLVGPVPPGLEGAGALVVWTTTPWTLLSNTGVAVNPDLTYAVIDGLVVAEDLADQVLGEGASSRASARVAGRELEGLSYERPMDAFEIPKGVKVASGWRVVLGEFVTTEEGTGLVHLAPAFGEIDREVGRASGLPVLNPVGPDGRFLQVVRPPYAGRLVREVNGLVDDELEDKGLLLRRELHSHPYPHCWRCWTPLIYWGKPSWFVATQKKKPELLAANHTLGWHPESIRDGRFGEWLEHNVDWALSRDRYWGTPLPIWRCDDGHVLCVESMAELSDLAGRDLSLVDPHRPQVDDVSFPCPECAGLSGAEVAAGAETGIVISGLDIPEMHRVTPVIDAWFDSGSMPAAQVGYPHLAGSKERFFFPADFIVEAIDQTRGWFYSLLAVNQLVFSKAPYREVMCLGHIVDAEGRKMSKSLGNAVDPWDLVRHLGADPLRWWMFSQGSPWTPTRVSREAIETSMRQTLLTLWNTAGFFLTYASLNGFTPSDPGVPEPGSRGVLDRWARARVASTVAEVTRLLDAYEPLDAALSIGRLVDDLSNWYVRRSRRRFWRTDPMAPPSDALSAQATLHHALTTVALLLAPFCPFLSDRLWRELSPLDLATERSVHLEDWPVPDPSALDAQLEEHMALARRIAALGRAARAEAGVRVRQPLSRAVVFLAPGAPVLSQDVAQGVAEELNVDRLVVSKDTSELLSLELLPNYRLLGPRLGDAVKEVRAALARLDPQAAAATLEAGGQLQVTLSTGTASLGVGEVDVRVRAQEGYAVSREGGAMLALDLTLDQDLRHRGLVREVVRHVQDLRKARSLLVSDRIALWLTGIDPSSYHEIAPEVLAEKVSQGPGPGPGAVLQADGARIEAWLELAGP